jgi:Flp pilus assembly protein TadG
MKKIIKDNRGQSLVEFILVLPVVLLLVFGVLSFGFLVYNKMIVVHNW